MEELSTHEQIMDTQEPGLELSQTEIISIDILCRLCANHNERVIGIYSEEGISNDLANKMNLYLPIKVSEHDSLPLHCCWSCASTVLAWHELVVASVEADRRLRGLVEKGVNDIYESPISLSRNEMESTDASLTVFCQDAVKFETSDQYLKHSSRKKTDESEEKGNWIKSEDILDDSLSNYIQNIQNPYITDCDADQNNEVECLETQKSDDEVSVEERRPKKPKAKRKSLRKGSAKKNSPHNLQAIKEEEIKTEDKGELDSSDDDRVLSEWITRQDDKTDMYNYVCQCCSSVYLQEEDIINHIKQDHPDKVDMLSSVPASELSKKERRKNTKIDQDAVNAAKVVVEGRIYYNCKICGKSLHSPYTYIWHMRIHTGERPYVCDLCGKQFRVSQGLVRHLRETHEGIKNFGCDLCGRMFATRRNVEEHRRIHTNERPYICDLCGKSFKQKASLFVHNRSHTDLFPFRCSYCNQGFRTRPPLMIHVTRHTGEKPYPCDICGRCFRIKYELKRHRLIHSDEKPFSCVECGLSFRQKRYLRNHNKINHNRATP